MVCVLGTQVTFTLTLDQILTLIKNCFAIPPQLPYNLHVCFFKRLNILLHFRPPLNCFFVSQGHKWSTGGGDTMHIGVKFQNCIFFNVCVYIYFLDLIHNIFYFIAMESCVYALGCVCLCFKNNYCSAGFCFTFLSKYCQTGIFT